MARYVITPGQGKTIKSIQRLDRVSSPHTIEKVDPDKTIVLNYFKGGNDGQGSAWYLSDSTTLTKLIGQNFTGEIIEFW